MDHEEPFYMNCESETSFEDQDEDINQEVIPHIEGPVTYKLGSLTFFRASYLINEEAITFEDPQQSREGLAPCFQGKSYPIANKIFQQMNYQGRGLGLHEQGILEPVQIIGNPKHQGLG